MPFTVADAKKHSSNAGSEDQQKRWVRHANGVLSRTNDRSMAIKSANLLLKTASDVKNPTKPGTTFTKTITRGPNKGDKVAFKVAAGGKPFPTRVLDDKGGDSTLKDNPGVKFGKKK